MSQTASEQLFARARELIPGGVNSPVRAFRSVGGAPFFTKSARGATLTTVDGKELIDHLSDSVITRQPIDFIITDVRMPRLTGIEALRLIKGAAFETA